MDIELCIYYNIVTIWFLFMFQSINLPPSAHTITSSAHCSTLQPSAAYSQASSAHPVHTLQQPLHLQCTHYSSHCIFSAHTTAAIASSVHTLQQPLHLQCTHYSSHYIFSAHCNHVQPCTAICSQSSMHTAANCSHLQQPTLSDANTIQCI